MGAKQTLVTEGGQLVAGKALREEANGVKMLWEDGHSWASPGPSEGLVWGKQRHILGQGWIEEAEW